MKKKLMFYVANENGRGGAIYAGEEAIYAEKERMGLDEDKVPGKKRTKKNFNKIAIGNVGWEAIGIK